MKRNIWKDLEIKMAVILLLVVFLLSSGIYYIKYSEYNALIIEQKKKDAVNIHKLTEDLIDERCFTNLNIKEDEKSDLYLTAHKQLDEIRRIANIRYLYTAKKNENGELIYVVDGFDSGDELYRHVGDPVEKQITPMLNQCLNDEIVFGDSIMNTEWGIVYVTYFPFHDSENNVIGAIGMEFDCEDIYTAVKRSRKITILISVLIASGFIILSLLLIRKIIRGSQEIYLKMEKALNEANELAMLMLDTSPVCAQI